MVEENAPMTEVEFGVEIRCVILLSREKRRRASRPLGVEDEGRHRMLSV